MPHSPNTEIDTKVKVKASRPRLYRVLTFNDDYSAFDFVIHLMKSVFHKSEDEAVAITEAVHTQGSCAVGVYTREVAETKVDEAHDMAKAFGFPLRLDLEPGE